MLDRVHPDLYKVISLPYYYTYYILLTTIQCVVVVVVVVNICAIFVPFGLSMLGT